MIVEKLGKTQVNIEEIIGKFEKKLVNLEKEFQNTCNFFCENSKEGSDIFIMKFYKFWNSCKQAKREILKKIEIKQKEMERKKREEEKIKLKEIKKLDKNKLNGNLI